MAQYVDGFVIVVPKKNLAEYKKQARLGCKIWMEHGALEYRETYSEEIKQTFGRPFDKLTGAKSSDVVVFAWIVFNSKAHRNRVNAKVMKDPRMSAGHITLPYDMDRLSYGGFATLVKS